jgi:hypothetical protein
VRSWAPALAAVGIFITHPGGAVVAAVLGAAIAAEIVFAEMRRHDARAALVRLASVAAVAIVAGLPWLLAAGDRGLGAAPAIAEVDLPTAISRVVLLGTPWTSPQPVVAALVWAGLAATVASRRAVGLSVAFLALVVLSIGTMAGLQAFAAATQSWHAHWYRIAAAFGVLVPFLAGLGMASVIALVRARIGTASDHAGGSPRQRRRPSSSSRCSAPRTRRPRASRSCGPRGTRPAFSRHPTSSCSSSWPI